MKFVVDWQTFVTKSGTGNIYFSEDEYSWTFYKVVQGSECMVSKVNKSEQPEQNIMFIDKYVTTNANMIRIIGMYNEHYTTFREGGVIAGENLTPVDDYEVAENSIE